MKYILRLLITIKTSFFSELCYDISCISTTRNNERYYNLSKVLIDNSYKQDISRITRNKYWIDFVKAIKIEFKYDVLNNKFILTKNSQSAEIRDLVDSDLYFHVLFMNYFYECFFMFNKIGDNLNTVNHRSLSVFLSPVFGTVILDDLIYLRLFFLQYFYFFF